MPVKRRQAANPAGSSAAGGFLSPRRSPSAPSIPTPAKRRRRWRLTEREKAWLDDHRSSRAGHDPNWAPIDFTTPAASPSGIAADMMACWPTGST